MNWTAIVVSLWIFTGCVAWLVVYLRALRGWVATPRLEDCMSGSVVRWPRVSVVVCARNEADTIARAQGTVLAQRYPNLQIVLVDDRSTDGTGAIIDDLAALDSRVSAVHVDRLPAGWIGKVHALQRGLERADGQWLLFTDADVHFGPDAIARAVAFATRHEFDHLTAIPEFSGRSPLVQATYGAIGMHLVAEGTGTGRNYALGAFNLVRRATFERTKGFRWLRMELADDFGLAKLLRDVDARSKMVLGHRYLTLEWYPRLADLFRGFEKNLLAQVGRFSHLRALLVAALIPSVVLAPALAFADVGMIDLRVLGWVCLSMFVLAGAAGWERGSLSTTAAILSPLGLLVIALSILWSSVHAWHHGGVVWRGTRYPLAALRSGRRA